MANSITHAGIPWPVRKSRYTITIPYLDGSGDPTSPVTPDTELIIDGAAAVDATEEVTVSGTGFAHITLTGAEMDCSMIAISAKAASGPKTTLLTLYPKILPVITNGTARSGSSSTIQLASAAPATDYTGCVVRTTGGTGGGGTGGANNQARLITSYNTTTKTATVTPNWETNPDNTTTYDILYTELSVAVINKMPESAYLAGADVSSGDPNINPNCAWGPVIAAGVTITNVESQTEVTISFPGDMAESLQYCTAVFKKPSDDHRAVVPILSSFDAGGNTVLILATQTDYVIDTTTTCDILAPVTPIASLVEKTWFGAPSFVGKIILTGGTSGGSTVTYSSPGAILLGNIKPGMAIKLTDVSSGLKVVGEIVSFSSTTCVFTGNPLPFTVQAGVDYIEIFSGGHNFGPVTSKSTIDLLRNMLPTAAPKLAGSQFNDGSIRAQDIAGLTQAVTDAIDQSEIEFNEEALDTMRDHFYGGKLFVAGTVTTSQVTPTTTTFAGDSDLSDSDDFYSKTSAVVAFATGELQGMCGVVVDYDGAKRQFYFDGVWPVAPQGGDQFVILGKITRPSS